MLEVRHLSVSLGERGSPREILRDVSLDVADGRIAAIVGASGSGKTTFLRALCGLVPSTGAVIVDGTEVQRLPTHRRNIGLMFQDDQLFPTMSVAENVGYGLKLRRLPRDERHRRVAGLLALVGLDGIENRDVTSLSGGEKRRVSLARALAPQPRVLLLDEPLTGLDPELRRRLQDDLATVLRSLSITTLLVTHDEQEATRLADEVIALGRINQL